jgi:hypothetical protein
MKWILSLLLMLPPATSASASPLTEVLDHYATTQKVLERCEQVTDVQAVLESNGNPVLHLRQRGEYRRDGGRAFMCYSESRDDPTRPMPDALPPLPPPAAEDLRFQSLYSSLSTPDGVTSFLHYPRYPSSGQVILDVVEDEAERLQLLPNDRVGCWMRGWLFDDRRRLDSILRDAADKATARPDTVAGRPCTLVEARTPGGHYAVWFDAGRGGNVVRLRVERRPHDLTRYGKVWQKARRGDELPEKVPYSPEDEKAHETIALDDVALEQVGDVWLPVSATLTSETVGRDGRRRGSRSLITTRWDLSPRFGPDAFRLDIPDGTAVSLRAGTDFVFPPLEWRNGRPVPKP